MRLTLVITTYERPDALAAVLATVSRQRTSPDEVIVADDGSGPATLAAVEAARPHLPRSTKHVVQPHEGFRLTRLRNLAIAASDGDYVVFIDGDMLLHAEFVADHRRAATPGAWIQGVRIPLDGAATRRLLDAPGTTPSPHALGLGGRRRLYGVHAPALARLLARPANAVIAVKGCNQGFWRDDLVAVNGYDEEFVGWGPEDKDLCARLAHRGIARRTLLFGGIAWHLDHSPAERTHREANEARLRATLATRRVRCERGLDAHV